jgi:hypothetical protein
MGQSLAAAARAEEARRQKNREKGVKSEVVDDKALQAAGGKGGTVNTAGAPEKVTASTVAPSSTREGGTPEGSAKGDGRGESYWRERVRAAEARLAEAQAIYDQLASMSLVPGEVYQDSKGKNVITSIQQLQEMTAQAKAERDAAKKELDDVHEDARRSGALPGWLR